MWFNTETTWPREASMSDRQTPHFAYIECVRGYAILLVITCHATYLFPELPYPVHRVTVLGWHGVQLFFLASAVTLMLSWQHEKSRAGSVDVGAFFLRRLFRIAPAYYLASGLYFLLAPPAGGFDAVQAAGTYLFVNAWHPRLMGVTPGAWEVVPGSWSVGVEFTFYALFPLLAGMITSLSRAVWLLVGSVVLGGVLNALLWPSLRGSIGAVPADNFLYFWFPNQLSVFAVGLCLFHLLAWERGRWPVLGAYPNLVALGAVAVVVGCGFVALPHWLDWRVPLPPTFLVVSLALAVFVLALARGGRGPFVNGPVALMGRVSFSAYLLHFAVLKAVSDQVRLGWVLHLAGWPAVAGFAVTLVCVVVVVLAVSWVCYRLVEMPMIALGKGVVRRRRLAVL
jgi:peptidoglycan/LPS O-acetylase OafA/YrhL